MKALERLLKYGTKAYAKSLRKTWTELYHKKYEEKYKTKLPINTKLPKDKPILDIINFVDGDTNWNIHSTKEYILVNETNIDIVIEIIIYTFLYIIDYDTFYNYVSKKFNYNTCQLGIFVKAEHIKQHYEINTEIWTNSYRLKKDKKILITTLMEDILDRIEKFGLSFTNITYKKFVFKFYSKNEGWTNVINEK